AGASPPRPAARRSDPAAGLESALVLGRLLDSLWSGEVISVAFAIDCHDREVLAFVASPRPLTGADIQTLMDRTPCARVGEATHKASHASQRHSDNGPQYPATATVLHAHELGLVQITTPAYSPESNGLAESFMWTFKRTMWTAPSCGMPKQCWPT